jgi:hypothetical protein
LFFVTQNSGIGPRAGIDSLHNFREDRLFTVSHNTLTVTKSKTSATTRSKTQPPATERGVFRTHVGKMLVSPRQQVQLSLGVFGEDKPEKGFLVELSPSPEIDDSVDVQTLSVGSARRYELVLHVANYGDQAVTAHVWRM